MEFSLTLQGALVLLFSFALKGLGIQWPDAELADFVAKCAAIAGAVITWYGRYRLGDITWYGVKKA